MLLKINRRSFPNHLQHLEGKSVHIPYGEWDKIPQVACFYYIYKKEGNSQVPLYVGHTQNLKKRIPTVCYQSVLAHNEGTHIAYYPEVNKEVRLKNRYYLDKLLFQG